MGLTKDKRRILADSFQALKFFYESAADSITAFAGGGQTSATLLTAQTSRVTTVATAGDSIKLPVSAAGLELIVVNSGANPMQVFGSGTDTINDVATATGISQLANSIEVYACPVAGKWYVDAGLGFAGSLSTDSTTDTLTAFAGGGQASATALTTQFNRITTVATIGDSVKLPAAVAGLDIIVMNHGANSMQVYGAGADQIDDVASASGVSQMAGSVCLYVCATSGKWYSNGIGTGFAGSLPTVSYTNGITAFAGGGQASAVQLIAAINRVTTVATAADSVKLPVAAPGLMIYVANGGASSMNVFPSTGDQINSLSVNAAFAVATNKTATFISASTGFWHAILSA